MPADEFEAWREFYALFPFDDRHRYHRPAAYLAAVGKQDPNAAAQAALQWLDPDPVLPEDADMRTLAAFGLKPRRGNSGG